ncbi:MAG: pyridoxal phosphate-dependent aminotransferase [Clostridiales Family XIII bacterium]|jgi:cystathionine beta-lyase|nr:pyridoxal phosphate-dependent aminotransferase [Clostridiales Family XIII bacterium]
MNIQNFDTIIDRRGTGSLKYDGAVPRGMPADILPLWVADMDFRVTDPITDALRSAVGHGVYGYTMPGDEYFDAVRAWWHGRHSYEFDAKSVTLTPGVVFALAQAVRAFTEPGDAVLVQRPVYYPFSEVIEDNGRRLVNSPLVLTDGGSYEMDFESFERRLHEDRPRLFILCSPHNPVGRVWRAAELARIGELCLAYDCLIVSDEIHADFTYAGNKHTVFSTVSDSFRERSVICTSPSKSFNLAALQISNIIIEDPALRRRFRSELNACGYSQSNMMGLAACRAAYEHGGPWFAELLGYLSENLALVRSFFPPSSEKLDTPRLIEPEGTYLPWIDFRGLGLSHDETDRRLIHDAKVWLDSGTLFGPEGEGFQRINIACPRSVLEDALTRIANAFAV